MDIKSIKSVKDLLLAMKVTPEELETHRELIEETEERDSSIKKFCSEARDNVQRIGVALITVAEKMEESSQVLEGIALSLTPENEFYKA